MKSYLIIVCLLSMAVNVLGQNDADKNPSQKDTDTTKTDPTRLVLSSNKQVNKELKDFKGNLKNEWDSSHYYSKPTYAEVCTGILDEYRRFSNQFITDAYNDGSTYYYKYILGRQNLARAYGIWEVEMYFQDFSMKLITKNSTSDTGDKLRAELNQTMANAIDSIDTETNDRIATIYSAYKVKHWRRFPAKTDIFAKLYYGELHKGNLLFLNNSTLIFGPDLNAITSNIVSGYFGSFPVRFSVNTVVAKGRNETVNSEELIGKTDDEIQDIVNANYAENVKNNTLAHVLNGGGFLGIKTEYPILSYNNFNRKGKPQLEISLSGVLSGQFEKAGVSVPTTEADIFYYLGTDVRLLLPLSEVKQDGKRIETFALFFSGSVKGIEGSKSFFRNLETKNSKLFSQTEFSGGLLFNGVKVYYTYVYFTKRNLNDIYPSRIGITYVPSFF